MMAATTRTLPLRVPPLPSESLESWLETLAHRYRAQWGDLLDAVAHVDSARRGYRLTVCPTDAEVMSIATATGADPDAVRAMTLAHFADRAVAIDAASGLTGYFPWGIVTGSRFCPKCLADTEGRWQLSWRLGWSFICLRHRCLLVDRCPGCHNVQRLLPLYGRNIPQPGLCATILHPPGSRKSRRCATALADIPTAPMRTSHSAVVAQHVINDMIERNIGDFGVYRHAPQPCRDVLGDIRSIARRLLTEPEPRVLEQLVPSDVLTAHREVRFWKRGRGRAPAAQYLGRCAPADAATAAVGVTGALSMLAADDIESACVLLRELLDELRAQGRVSLDWVLAREPLKTPVLKSIERSALEQGMGALREPSYRIATGPTQIPSTHRTTEVDLIHCVPTLLWQAWSLLIAPPQLAQKVVRPTLSAAILLVGSKDPLSHPLEKLRSPLAEARARRAFGDLSHSPYWPNIRAALVRLHDFVADNPPPIDYSRRRILDYRDLLNVEQWLDICKSSGTRLRADCLTTVQFYLYERISCMPGALANYEWSNSMVAAYARQLPRRLTPELEGALHAHAEAFLRAHGIDTEPVDWHPDVRLVDDLELPGADSMQIDTGALHQLIREDDLSLAACAERLRSTVPHLRYILSIDPAPCARRRGSTNCPE
ncbi:TniQ family protein [Mycolicibacterium porcinum]|uniref:TniQ family protein n=1 Tax=Mycolicibacterium porcinum TaxID=39693 RepID=A0AAW5SWZ4_9MYCO|nr:TniQ family protein [Mycolicibacterium porcinum]MCV7386445.1 TniQ family protein [Mycolicibacterium porcinum]ORB39053.1 hypothetical protein BST41_18760 [Mycolicibacterium porcinum]CDO30883.1 regulatory helix-turn-helix protein, lysR family [Mycolicibacterium vulneris]